MFLDDAQRAVMQAGYAMTATVPPSRNTTLTGEVKEDAVVWAQSPRANTYPADPTTVSVRAVYAHYDLAKSASVHGRFYLRYGVVGSRECAQCHPVGRCSMKYCHNPDSGRTPLDSTAAMLRDYRKRHGGRDPLDTTRN